LSAGQMANSAYWYDDLCGAWLTSSWYMDTLPRWVKEFNKNGFADIYLNKIWDTMLPIDEYSESLPDNNPYETGIDRTYYVFPYNLTEIQMKKAQKQKNYQLLNYLPYGNNYTKDFALAAIVNENLGKDQFTDLLIISFSSTDYIGHYFGPRSVEIEDTYLRLDKEIEHFLQFIDDEIGKENTLIFLTSDHGVADCPQYLKDNKAKAGMFRQSYALALLKSYLNALYGEGEWVTDYLEQQIYLNHDLIEKAKIPPEEIQENCAKFMVITYPANMVRLEN
ncbi:MAG: alkaline phosphatase family protein, partial [Bacteroidia bacterium]|nr:alkaline phosphatase family protein [Bacteroidia bacterium]